MIPYEPLFPFVKKIGGMLLSDKIIGMRPGETWEEACTRATLERRYKKIINIQNKINKNHYNKK